MNFMEIDGSVSLCFFMNFVKFMPRMFFGDFSGEGFGGRLPSFERRGIIGLNYR